MKFQFATSDNLSEIIHLYEQCRKNLLLQDIKQWPPNYPSEWITIRDIKNENIHCIIDNNQIIGVITIDENQDPEYKAVHWNMNDDNPAVIHRMAVSPEHQRKGIAKRIMDYAEDIVYHNNYTSIRLDAYSQNERVLRFYRNRRYHERGTIYLPGITEPFICFEKDRHFLH